MCGVCCVMGVCVFVHVCVCACVSVCVCVCACVCVCVCVELTCRGTPGCSRVTRTSGPPARRGTTLHSEPAQQLQGVRVVCECVCGV